MKRELIFLMGLSSTIYATQDISCVNFVNMKKSEAKSYINSYRQKFELNHFKTKNHTDIDKQYIGMQGGVSTKLLTCIDLRRVTYYGVEDVRRALLLNTLSKKVLAQEEEKIYQKSLNKNIQFYKAYSKSSLFNANYMPLVYLTVQRSDNRRHFIIYEFRKNGAEIKRFSKKILCSNPYVDFSDINALSNQNYLAYLNSNKINPALKVFKQQVAKYPKRVKQPIVSPTVNNLQEYRVVKKFDAIRVFDNGKYEITREFNLIKIRDTKRNVYFSIQDEEYYASKIWWNKGTKRVGGVE